MASTFSETQLDRLVWAQMERFRSSMHGLDAAASLIAVLLFARRFGPTHARKSDLFKKSIATPEDAAAGIREMLEALETRIPVLAGVTNGLPWEVAFRGASGAAFSPIRAAMDEIGELDLSNASLPAPSTLTRVVRNIHRRVEGSGKTGWRGTPDGVAEFLVRVIEPKPGETVHDPTCGFADVLLAAHRHIRKADPESNGERLSGQEINVTAASWAKLLLALDGAHRARIELGNTLTAPQFVKGGHLERFDVVISDLPFGTTWDSVAAVADPFGRFDGLRLPPSRGDSALLAHVLTVRETKGRAVLLVPQGVAFRGGAEQGLRARMLGLEPKSETLDAVVGLPAALLEFTQIPTMVFRLDGSKPAQRRGYVRFVDASISGRRATRRTVTLDEKDVVTILHVLSTGKDKDGVRVRTVAVADLLLPPHDLSVSKHLPMRDDRRRKSVTQWKSELDDAERARDELEKAMDEALLKLVGGKKSNEPWWHALGEDSDETIPANVFQGSTKGTR